MNGSCWSSGAPFVVFNPDGSSFRSNALRSTDPRGEPAHPGRPTGPQPVRVDSPPWICGEGLHHRRRRLRHRRRAGAGRAGIPFDCFEKGSYVGGNWRFENDNGMSSAYRSLHINTSRRVMAFKTLPMPDHFPDYPNHFQMAAYFDEYVDHFGLREKISFRTEVVRVEPVDGAWAVTTRRETPRASADQALPGGARRQRPPLGPALAGAGLPRLRGVRGRADARPPLPRARRAARQAGARARDRQLRRRHRGRVLADRREDLPRRSAAAPTSCPST